MSVIGKKLNPIEASGGHGDENTTTTTAAGATTPPSTAIIHSQSTKITPDDVLRLTQITDDYLCSSGWIDTLLNRFSFCFVCFWGHTVLCVCDSFSSSFSFLVQ